MSHLADLYVMFDHVDRSMIDYIHKKCEYNLKRTCEELQNQYKQLMISNAYWSCPQCTFHNNAQRKCCQVCNAVNDIEIRKHEHTTEAMLNDVLQKYRNALSSGANNVDLEMKIDYNIGPWNCPDPTCGGHYCVQIFTIGEMQVKMERDQYKKQVIVVRTQKSKRIAFFKVKASDRTETTVIETKRIDTAELGIKNIPIAIACVKCEYIIKLNHCQELVQLLIDRVLKHTI
eukprot:639875_1